MLYHIHKACQNMFVFDMCPEYENGRFCTFSGSSFLGAFWVLWGSLGALLGPSWGLLGLSWGYLEPS